MKEYSLKRSDKHDARQAVREARKAANRRHISPDRIAAIQVLPTGEEVVFHKPVSIPGYTYSF